MIMEYTDVSQVWPFINTFSPTFSASMALAVRYILYFGRCLTDRRLKISGVALKLYLTNALKGGTEGAAVSWSILLG